LVDWSKTKVAACDSVLGLFNSRLLPRDVLLTKKDDEEQALFELTQTLLKVEKRKKKKKGKKNAEMCFWKGWTRAVVLSYALVYGANGWILCEKASKDAGRCRSKRKAQERARQGFVFARFSLVLLVHVCHFQKAEALAKQKKQKEKRSKNKKEQEEAERYGENDIETVIPMDEQVEGENNWFYDELSFFFFSSFFAIVSGRVYASSPRSQRFAWQRGS
jgi:hypothetical protein